MKTFYIETFGCQMNAHDSEKVIGTLIHEGYSQVETPEAAAGPGNERSCPGSGRPPKHHAMMSGTLESISRAISSFSISFCRFSRAISS